MSKEIIRTTQESLLATADALFTSQGYRATGVKQIVDEAGLARQTFYNHFPSKEALGIAWLKKRQNVWLGELSTTMDACRKQEGRLLAIFTFLDDYLRTHQYRGCPFLNISAEITDWNHPMRQAAIQYKTELREMLLRETEQLRKDGQKLKAKKREQIADHLYLLFEGALADAQVRASVWPVEAARKAAKRLLKDL